jgi:hypothetical protein
MIMTMVVLDFHSSFLFQRFSRGMYSHLEKSVRKLFLSLLFSIKGEIEQKKND